MANSKRGLWPAIGGWLVFMASAATLGATLARVPLLPMHELNEFHLLGEVRRYGFFDLKIYRRAAEIVGHGGPLYTAKLRHGLGFTYPPLAALLFLGLRWFPILGDEIAVTMINVALVAVIAHVALRLRRSPEQASLRNRDVRRRRRLITTGWLAAAVALWVEPVLTTFGYGQIDLLITACVLVDLVYGRRSRAGGLGIGLAAALKLTPLVFIPYLALTGRPRMALRALAAFALAIGVALVVVPRDARAYWFGGKLLDLSRVTGHKPLAGSGAANQSLRGALMRLLPPGTSHVTLIWMLACAVVGAVAMLLAVRAARRGDEAWGFTLVALTGLLICPVSWTHHWTIAVAGLIALAGAPGRPVPRALRTITALAFVAGSSAIWLLIRPGQGQGRPTGALELLLGNLYVLIGLGVIATAAALELRYARGRRTRAVRRVSLGPLVPAGPSPAFAAPGHPGDPVGVITTSQALAPDRQSLR